MRQYPWLHYSKHVDGVFYHGCVFFTSEKVSRHTLEQFVTKAFKTWVKICEKMEAHAKLEYHMTAMIKMSEFFVQFQHPSEAINAQLDKKMQEKMEKKSKSYRVIDQNCDAVWEARNCSPWTSK